MEFLQLLYTRTYFVSCLFKYRTWFAYNVYMIEFLYLIPLPIESVRYRHTVFHKCFIRIMWYNVNLISSSCQTFLLNYNLYMNTYIDAIITYT